MPYRLINRFERAVREDTNKGGGHPASIPDIEAEFKAAKKALVNYIKSLKGRFKIDNSSGSPKW